MISENPAVSSPTTQTVSSFGALVFGHLFEDESIEAPMRSPITATPTTAKKMILFLERELRSNIHRNVKKYLKLFLPVGENSLEINGIGSTRFRTVYPRHDTINLEVIGNGTTDLDLSSEDTLAIGIFGGATEREGSRSGRCRESLVIEIDTVLIAIGGIW